MLTSDGSTFMGWIYGTVVLGFYSVLWSTSCLYSAEVYIFSRVHHLFISLTLIRHRAIVHANAHQLLTPPDGSCISRTEWARKSSEFIDRLSWLKVGRSRPEDYVSAFWTLSPNFLREADKQTNVGRKEHRNAFVHLNRRSDRSQGSKSSLYFKSG